MTDTRGEAARKSIHVVATLGAAAVVLLLPPLPAAIVLAGATALALAVEVLRFGSARFARRFRVALGPMLRQREAVRLTGATTLSIGYTLAAIALPGAAAMAGIILAGIGDAAAAVVGRRWGRRRYPGGKSVEGSGAFLVVVAGLGLALGLDPLAALAAAVILTLLEALTFPVDDNLYLAVAAAAVFRLVTGVPGLPFFS